MDNHVYAAHMESKDGMKFVKPRPFADPDAAARKLVEIAMNCHNQ